MTQSAPKRAETWLHICKYTLVTVVVFFMVFSGLYVSGIADRFLGGRLYRVATASMEPALSVGDYVIAAPVNVQDVSVGDILVYLSDDPAIPGRPVAHRLIEIEEKDGKRYYHMKGDATPEGDVSVVDGHAILSRVVRTSPLITTASRIVKSPAFLVVFVALPALGWLALTIVRFIRSLGAAKQKKARWTALGMDPKDPSLQRLIEAYGEEEVLNQIEASAHPSDIPPEP